MEIKISDMMDQTAECNETLTSAGTEVDFDKVKQSVMKKAQTKPVHKKSIFIESTKGGFRWKCSFL